MIITARTALVRNLLVAGTNGAITLIILLIAPLGLAAVWANTLLVVAATFGTATLSDRVILFLQGGHHQPLNLPGPPGQSALHRRDDNLPPR
jgi:hypothetical protein